MSSLIRQVTYWLPVLAIGLGAFLFRLPMLDKRPLHADEAVHAVKLGALLDEGRYAYNPHEYHGPTLYFLALPAVWMSGARSFSEIKNEVPLLIVPVICGAMLVVGILCMHQALGYGSALVAAILAAVSPAMVFYSRYFIQEILLVLFGFSLIASCHLWVVRRNWLWAIAAGVFAGLMVATKETSLIYFGAMVGALIGIIWWPGEGLRVAREAHFKRRHVTMVGVIAVLVSTICLTNILRNWSAMRHLLEAYTLYADRAVTGDSSTHGEAIHRQPWYYYLQLLGYWKLRPGPSWSEAVVLIPGSLGMVAALFRPALIGGSPRLWRFLALFTLLLTIAYCIIPYKTPWNVLGFLFGYILLAGGAAGAVWRVIPWRVPLAVLTLVFVLCIVQYSMQSYRANFRFYADDRNPYVYAGTTSDVKNLVDRIEGVAAVTPDRNLTLVEVMAPASDYWPLPWYLRRFPNVGYYENLPAELRGSVVVAAASMEDRLDAMLEGNWHKEYFGLRSDVMMLVYVRQSLWQAFVKTRGN